MDGEDKGVIPFYDLHLVQLIYHRNLSFVSKIMKNVNHQQSNSFSRNVLFVIVVVVIVK